MRQFQGVRARLAQEFSGFSGSAKMFRDFHKGKVEQTQYHRYYTPADIRAIRLKTLGIQEDAKRPASIPPIIDTRMPKGGVGKTTISSNLAVGFALFGHRVLLIDGDPQASLTGVFGIDWSETDITHIGHLMQRAATGQPAQAEQAVVHLYDDGMLDLIPSDISMSVTENQLTSAPNREQIFNRLLRQEIAFFSKYDVIIIDSAPSTSVMTTNFMLAAKMLFTPVNPEGQSVEALKILNAHLYELNSAFEINVDMHLVVNRYNQSKAPHNEWLAKLMELYPDKINDTPVREFVGFLRDTSTRSVTMNGPLLEREPQSIGARDIIDLTKSLIKVYDIRLADLTATSMATAA